MKVKKNTISELYSKLSYEVSRANQRTTHHIFLSYVAHVNKYCCDYYLDGWKEDAEAIKVADYSSFTIKNLKDSIAKVKAIK